MFRRKTFINWECSRHQFHLRRCWYLFFKVCNASVPWLQLKSFIPLLSINRLLTYLNLSLVYTVRSLVPDLCTASTFPRSSGPRRSSPATSTPWKSMPVKTGQRMIGAWPVLRITSTTRPRSDVQWLESWSSPSRPKEGIITDPSTSSRLAWCHLHSN